MKTLTRNQEIAQTILAQLGGQRFKAMTGARQFVAIEAGLQFKLPARFASDGINSVEITLTASDIYNVRYASVNLRAKNPVRIVREERDLYCDQLRESFTRNTGLDTHL